jgi:hypothetical protein
VRTIVGAFVGGIVVPICAAAFELGALVGELVLDRLAEFGDKFLSPKEAG